MGAGSGRAETWSQPHPLAATLRGERHVRPLPNKDKEKPMHIMEHDVGARQTVPQAGPPDSNDGH
jgi:hypothetical protein